MDSLWTARCGRPGFTLLELMVVLGIIGILTAVLVPAMRGTFEAELLHAQTRRFLGAIDLAYSRAVTRNQPHRVRLNLDVRRYVVEGRVQDPEGKAQFAPVPYSPGAEGEIDPRITIQIHWTEPAAGSALGFAGHSGFEDARTPLEGTTFTLYPDGTADAVEIVLQDRQGFRRALRLNPVTGRVQVRELPRR